MNNEYFNIIIKYFDPESSPLRGARQVSGVCGFFGFLSAERNGTMPDDPWLRWSGWERALRARALFRAIPLALLARFSDICAMHVCSVQCPVGLTL